MIESMNKPDFISLLHRKTGLSERKTVLFVGRYRQKNLPNTESRGAGPGFVSWLHYHCVILANSPGFCFEFSTNKIETKTYSLAISF